jgi:phage gp29-like protein
MLRGMPADGAPPDLAATPELLHVFEHWAPFAINAWDVPAIKSALDAHDDGDLSRSSALDKRLGRDGRVKAALGQRVNAVLGLPLVVEPAARAWEGRGLATRVRDEAESIFSTGACGTSVQRWLLARGVMLGVAIAQVTWRTEQLGDGQLRWSIASVTPWPMHAARWDRLTETWQAITREGTRTITPGDGKWLVHQTSAVEPWLEGEVRSLGMTWADGMYARRDRSRRSAAAAIAAFAGELPAGVAISSEEGQAFKAQIQGLQRGGAGIIRPAGSKLEALELEADMYKLFDAIVDDAIADTAVALVGQTGTTQQGTGLGDGGNKVHDGVRYDLLEADVAGLYGVRAREGRASVPGTLTSQLLRPWTMLNWGRAEVCPLVTRPVPDVEEDERLKAEAGRHEAFLRVLAGYRAASIEVDQEQLAAQLGVRVPWARKRDRPPP